MQRLVAIGVASRSDPAAAAILDRLAAGTVWARVLHAWAGYGHRDPARLRAAAAARAGAVRRAAIRVAARVLAPDALATLLDAPLAAAERRRVLALLAGRDREAVDRWLEPRLGVDPRAIDALPFGSDALVRRALPAFVDRARLAVWSRLAVHHPAVVRDVLLDRITGDALDPRTAHLAATVIAPMASRSPALAMPLLTRLIAVTSPHDPAWAAAVARLARRAPVATFDALRAVHDAGRVPAPGAFARVRFDRRPDRLGVDRLQWLIEHAWTALPDGRHALRWLATLSDADRRAVIDRWLTHGHGPWGAALLRFVDAADPRRAAAFARWRAASRTDRGQIAPEALVLLPRDLRRAEALRHLADPELSPEAQLAYGALLPVAEATDALAAAIGHPEGEIRALALGAVIRAVRHDRAALPDALAVVARRRFEQDPVRAAMLGALAGLPHAVWSAAALPALGEVLGHAWDAADLSPATAGYAEQLVVRGFRHDPAWGARALARSLAVRGTIVTDGLLDGLPIASRRSLLPALAEAARGWTTRERWVAVQWVCRQVERDLRHAPGLVALLVEIAREVPYPGHTAAALALLARWDRAAFEPLADALLAADRSAAALGPIGTYVATRGQRWLDRVLAAPLAGRWATGRSWWTTYSGFATWSEDDQAQYAATLRAHVGDSGQPVSALAWPVTQLAALGWTDPAPLIALADDPRPPIRDWAVQAIGRLDADVAVPALLRFLDDDRARRAILALGPRLGELPPDRALAVLLAAPRTRVTVAKEIARRIGDLGTDEAHRALLAIAAEPLHRDVTIAVLRGLWSHLDRDETWAVFARAAASPDVVLASRLAEIGTEALSPAADARFCDLLASLVARPEDELRVRVLRALHRAPIRDPSRTLLRALIARIGDPAVRSRDERTAVVTAAVLRANLEDADAIAVRLAGCADVHALLDGIAPLSGTSWLDPRVDRVRRRLAEALGEDAALVPIALRLWGQREAEALVAALRRLAGRGWLGFDALVSAMGAIGASPDPDAIERTLRSDPDPTLARLGLAALEHAAGRDDLDRWTEDRRTALDAYRSHPSPAVHGPARMVRPPG